jgi:eukaryotic-like serine/threonine-protein kinase
VPPLPTSFGNFILLRALGSGGGTSWAVGPTPQGQQLCVLKRPPEDRREEPEYLARFRRAAHLSRRLSHEGLATVFDVGEVAGEPYVSEELVEGHDLAEVMQRCAAESRHIPVPAAIHIVCESARALAYLHDFEGLHLAHRKLRPSKIRLTYAGSVKVLDLASGRVAGAEALLRPALLAETLPYLAPEQLGDGPIDARADIYALGAILWECLAGCSLLSTIEGGQASLGGIPREQVAQKILAHQPPPPSRMNPEVRPELDTLVMRALARTSDSRMPAAHGLELALAPLAGTGGRDAAVRLMSRLFDASREREERAALLAESAGHAPRVSHAELPALPSAESAEGGKRKTGRSLTPIPREPNGLGTGSGPSATALVSRNARWLKRFGLIFAPVLGAAILFNVLMTRRFESQWAAQAAAASVEAPAVAAPAAPTPALPPSPAPALAPAAPQVAAPTATPTPAREAKPESKRPSTAPVGPAAVAAAKAAPLPASTRPLAEAPARRSSAPGPEAKKALDEARQAFESDDFARAIKKGREALELGEGRAHAILGAAYFKIGRFDEATRAYKEALRLDPRNPSLEKRVDLARRAASSQSE